MQPDGVLPVLPGKLAGSVYTLVGFCSGLVRVPCLYLLRWPIHSFPTPFLRLGTGTILGPLFLGVLPYMRMPYRLRI